MLTKQKPSPLKMTASESMSIAPESEFGVVGSAREWDYVANIGHAGHEEHEALEAETEAGMRHSAEAACVEIPPHIFHRYVELFDAAEKLVVIGLTLRSADDLADLGEQDIHGAHGAVIFVELHIECLDFLRIVGEDHGLLEMLLNEVALMLALQVGTPVNREVKLLAGCLKDLDTLGVGEAHELVFDNELQTVDKLGIVHLGKEVDIILAVFQSVADTVFDEVFGKVHIVGDVEESYFGLDHPELRQVARSVGVFCTESRTEGIDSTEGRSTKLAFKLTAHGQCRGLAEEVGRVVDLSIFVAGRIVDIEGRYLEHGTCTLTVARRDERSIEIEETTLLEELVDGEGKSAAYTEHRAEGVGAGTQVSLLAQELKRVAFLLKRIGLRIGRSEHFEGLGLNLDGLTLALAIYKAPGDVDARTCGDRTKIIFTEEIHVEHDLHVADGGTIVEGHKLNMLVSAAGTDPAHHAHLGVDKRRVVE